MLQGSVEDISKTWKTIAANRLSSGIGQTEGTDFPQNSQYSSIPKL